MPLFKTPPGISDLQIFAKVLRATALKMVHRAKSAHIGGSLSMADLLAVLYGKLLRINPSSPEWSDRDRFILSKGHACAGLYAALAMRGFFPEDWLDSFCQDGGKLAGHVTKGTVPGVEVSTGALGHGLSIGCGMALAAKRDEKSYRTFVLLSDGECDEGTTWEAILFAAHFQLDHLIAIVDYNKIQSLGHVKDVLALEPLAAKWESFGWAVREINGHKIDEIEQALETLPLQTGKPTCIIAHTVKGKGVSFMENKLLWHYRNPNAEEMKTALKEIEGNKK